MTIRKFAQKTQHDYVQRGSGRSSVSLKKNRSAEIVVLIFGTPAPPAIKSM
jgi:hypothetical protein